MESSRYPALLVAHGALVIGAGMLAGFALGFELVGSLSPAPGASAGFDFPGTEHGWRAAHVGCVTNGLLLLGVAAALPRLVLTAAQARFVTFALVAVAWGNTCFYVFSNFAPNRGLTLGANRFGEATLVGALAYLPAIVAALLVLAVLAIVARGAFAAAGAAAGADTGKGR